MHWNVFCFGTDLFRISNSCLLLISVETLVNTTQLITLFLHELHLFVCSFSLNSIELCELVSSLMQSARLTTRQRASCTVKTDNRPTNEYKWTDKFHIEFENELPLSRNALSTTASTAIYCNQQAAEDCVTEWRERNGARGRNRKAFTKTEGKCHSAGVCSKPFQVSGSWGWILKEPHL